MAERVRMEVLRALSFEPRVLILDEPTGLLAPSELAAFLDVLRRLRGEGRIVILVTHKLAEEQLAVLMVGELAPPPPDARATGMVGAVALKLEDLVVERDGWRALDGV